MSAAVLISRAVPHSIASPAISCAHVWCCQARHEPTTRHICTLSAPWRWEWTTLSLLLHTTRPMICWAEDVIAALHSPPSSSAEGLHDTPRAILHEATLVCTRRSRTVSTGRPPAAEPQSSCTEVERLDLPPCSIGNCCWCRQDAASRANSVVSM